VTASLNLSPLFLSIATTCAATFFTFFLGLAAARAMYGMKGPIRAWTDGILTLPLVLPPTVVGFFLLLIFGRRSFLGHALERLGIMIAFSWPATVIAATVVAFPLMYRTTLGAFEQVNPTLLQVAETLGASNWRIFRRVLLPLAGPGVLAGTILSFARALGEFGATLMLAGNIPGRTQTMPIAIFADTESGNMRGALLWVLLIVGLSLAIIRLLNREGALRTGSERFTRSALRSASETPLSIVSRWQPTEDETSRAKLDVKVVKTLQNFRLAVELHAGNGSVGLLGASGAGKTMTLRLIAGILTPDMGRIALNGRVLYDGSSGTNLSPAARRIGIVFQDYALFPHMTAAQNIAFGLMSLPSQERAEKVSRQLAFMHIEDLAHRYPSEMSGGQRQRVALARALATEPDALLLDEPFTALDPFLRRQMEERLRETLASYGGAVLFVTHDMEEAFRFCSELVVLEEGKVIAAGPKHELFNQPRKVVAARLTGCKNIVPARRIADGRIAVDAWSCELSANVQAGQGVHHVGMRSHQIAFTSEREGENSFACWPLGTSEAPHEITVYLRLHAPAQGDDPPHLQADISKELWRELQTRPLPWYVRLDRDRLLLLED
jgi:molybdate ABC transporter permease protein